MIIEDLIQQIRLENSDNAFCEAKKALGGFPENVVESICAFANTPKGGVAIFGLDEAEKFKTTGVYDVADCQKRLAAIARDSLIPNVTILTEVKPFEEKQLVVATVVEASESIKPVKVKKTGVAYIRQYDGDYQLSKLEEQLFIANRGPSLFDLIIVDGASITDLDDTLVRNYITTRKQNNIVLNKMDDDEILLRTGIVTSDKQITTAGLLALGTYPQQFITNYAIQASVQIGDDDNIRAIDPVFITGPIATILETALDWVLRNAGTYLENLPDGNVRSVPNFPEVACRELISNALIHRDLNPISLSTPISLIIKDGELVISNPGGLYGVTVDTLGKTAPQSRNEKLSEICQNITTQGGDKVVERLGTGIPNIRKSLKEAGLPDAFFYDQGIRFTAKLTNKSLSHTAAIPRKASSNYDLILVALSKGELSRAEIEKITGLTKDKVRRSLKALMDSGKVVRNGKVNSPTSKYEVK
ncbi:MAG: putative DNA binding domain-containing protein [Clostridiales Family XIII bacterium]|jgi:ATP-dependent DNA helicase RecG|nr:putative DNA binding domain-containing protein [Clostridiales Family XIII bacterium]